jgi:PKD repeat protein
MKQRLPFFNVVPAIFCLFIFMVPLLSFSQKENNIWYFGNGAGLDFNSGSPVPLTNGAINTTEGCASVADTGGSLLFYTDGVTVYNKVHNTMVNGIGLKGGNSSSESAIIVPLPGSSSQYYIFTTPDQGSLDGLNYSVVDMTLQGGFGEVVILNTLLHAPIGEKVCATHHANGTDYWIVAHEYNSDAFYAYQLSATGVNPVPVISNVGLVHMGYHGYLKFTPDASKIGLAVGETDNLELLDFNNSTGVVSNPLTFPTTWVYPYGVEFSPDNSKFYVAQSGVLGTAGIYQFDMLAGSGAAIIASGQLVGTTTNQYLGPLQLAPDGKIYCARYPTGTIGVIDNPNASGLACNYIDNAVFLNGGTSLFGLPNQIPHFDFIPAAAFTSPNHICPGTCTDFTNHSVNANSYQWIFSGANPGVSNDVNPSQICYNTPGQYDVTLIASNATHADTLTLHNYITVYPYPAPQGISQSGDTLFANQGAVSYQWYFGGGIISGATDYFYVASQSGNYNVVATDENDCEVEAVIFDVVAATGNITDGALTAEIFPVPVHDRMKIRSALLSGIAFIEIYQSDGKRIFFLKQDGTMKKDQEVFDIADLPAGIYCLKITDRINTVTTKFLKQ